MGKLRDDFDIILPGAIKLYRPKSINDSYGGPDTFVVGGTCVRSRLSALCTAHAPYRGAGSVIECDARVMTSYNLSLAVGAAAVLADTHYRHAMPIYH